MLKVGDQVSAEVTLYGQENDATATGLARMNTISHDNATAGIRQGNTLANPPSMSVGLSKKPTMSEMDRVSRRVDAYPYQRTVTPCVRRGLIDGWPPR